MSANTKEWMAQNFRNMKLPGNADRVTLRFTPCKNRKVSIKVSIGLTVCDILNLNKGDRVNIYIGKKDNNIMMIKKCDQDDDGYKLGYCTGSRYLTFAFTTNFYTNFKLCQTIRANFDFSNEGLLFIDLTKMKWEK